MATEISSSAGKALEIFKVICDFGAPCSIADIVRKVDYPRTVTGRMVATLLQYDFIEKLPESGLYCVKPKLLHTVQKALNNDPLLQRVDLMMREIATETEDTALFMIKSQNQALVVRRLEGSAPIRIMGSRVGMELPLHCGGAPKALLTFSPDDDIDEYLSGPLAQRTPATITDPQALRDRIARDRARGFCVGNEDLFEFVVALGAPVMDSQGQLAGAISVGNITQRYPPERIEEVGQMLVEAIARF